MTYCVALRLDPGILFCSDSRTNAGVDHIATFSKMKVFERKDDRVMVLLSSGNLSVTQSVFNILEKHKDPDAGADSIWTVDSLYDAACLVGDALREVQRRDGPFLQGSIEAALADPRRADPWRGPAPVQHLPARQFPSATTTRSISTGREQVRQAGAGVIPRPRIRRMPACWSVRFNHPQQHLGGVAHRHPVVSARLPLRVGLQKRIEDGKPYFQHAAPGCGRACTGGASQSRLMA
jgi:putative proteasome-type protease